jgi:hypothetical protein
MIILQVYLFGYMAFLLFMEWVIYETKSGEPIRNEPLLNVQIGLFITSLEWPWLILQLIHSFIMDTVEFAKLYLRYIRHRILLWIIQRRIDHELRRLMKEVKAYDATISKGRSVSSGMDGGKRGEIR